MLFSPGRMRFHYVLGFAQCCFSSSILGLGLSALAGPVPSMEITVSCPPDVAKWGEPLQVSGTVTNTGKTTITNIVITDSSGVGDGPIATLFVLDPGQELAFSGSWRLVPSNTCSITHNVFTIGTSTHGESVTNMTSAACQVAPHTRLDLAVDCPPTPPVPGQLFNFTGSFTNKSDYVVTSTVLYVYQGGSNVLSMPVPLLYPGEDASFSGSYRIPTNGPATASITNTYIIIGASYCGYLASNMVTQVCPLQGQATSNDNFANRTVLTGSSITFTGTLVGATLETFEDGVPGYMPTGGGSVWWTWTAPETTRVVIEIPHTPYTTNAALAVYTGNAIYALTLVDQSLFGDPPGRYVSFLASPTNTYQFRVAGIGTQPFFLRLTATNPPVFIFQPQDCVVSPFGSAFFSAMATGPGVPITYPAPLSPTSYQWSFNGVPMAGQTFPSLIIHAVTTNQAGSYSVIASNIGGVTQGGASILTVLNTNPVPRIVALQPTNSSRVPLSLRGEPGRWYKIESAPDFSWFPFGWFVVRTQLTNTSDIISLTRFDPTHFVRASLDVPTDVCVAQLKQMWWGQKVFAIEHRLSPNDVVALDQLRSYVHLSPQGDIPVCPAGGTYTTTDVVTNAPTCTLSTVGHRLIDLP